MGSSFSLCSCAVKAKCSRFFHDVVSDGVVAPIAEVRQLSFFHTRQRRPVASFDDGLGRGYRRRVAFPMCGRSRAFTIRAGMHRRGRATGWDLVDKFDDILGQGLMDSKIVLRLKRRRDFVYQNRGFATLAGAGSNSLLHFRNEDFAVAGASGAGRRRNGLYRCGDLLRG